jgi:hypothetical protein
MARKIRLNLTPGQMEELKPLFDTANKKPMQGVVIGQAWNTNNGDGYAVFQWMKPAEIIRDVNEMVEKANSKIIEPA